MKACFSWLKKSVEDAERLSDAVAALACVLACAGTLALAAEKDCPAAFEAETSAAAVPARVRVCLADFVPAPENAERKIAPEETPPAPSVPAKQKKPAPPKQPEPAEEKIDEAAIREILEETPPPQDDAPPEPPEEKSPPPPQEKEEERPPQESAPPAATPAPAPPESREEREAEETARREAKRTLYGALADAVRRKKFYPKAARRNGRTGTVELRVEISEAGEIASFSVAACRAHESLKAGALETLRRVAEDFRVPAGTETALPAAFILPVVYELK